MSVIELGESVPALTPHATSVSLPTWADNVGYEEGEQRVVDKMTIGYPRFFINTFITAFAADIVTKYGSQGQKAMLFPTRRTAQRCLTFIKERAAPNAANHVKVITLVIDKKKQVSETIATLSPSISAVIYNEDIFPIAKQYWQHSGDGVSSRRAEFCHNLFQEGKFVDAASVQPTSNGLEKSSKGPRRYQKGSIDKTGANDHKNTQSGQGGVSQNHLPGKNGAAERESDLFLEERFGRNLDISMVDHARSAIRRRISGSLLGDVDVTAEPKVNVPSNTRSSVGLPEEDVYLYPCGMNSIFNTHQMFLKARGPLKSISFGFPYVDTLKVLEKFGPGVLFYGNGDSADLDDLESRLKAGERYLALFCEFPGNPMLKCPDLKRIKRLADAYDFGIVIDETIGNFINVHVLPYADVLVSSLTKIFSGECNVMGGSAIINPQGHYYKQLKEVAATDYEDNYWAEDIIFMERNSRHFVSRIERINVNAELICSILQAHPLVKDVFYPKFGTTKIYYDDCRTPDGGYGGLLSFTFHKKAQAVAFYDRIETAKGPSLGTNFTLISPYVVIAHYLEMDWAAKFGVPSELLRISVGLEDAEDLKTRFAIALQAAELVDA